MLKRFVRVSASSRAADTFLTPDSSALQRHVWSWKNAKARFAPLKTNGLKEDRYQNTEENTKGCPLGFFFWHCLFRMALPGQRGVIKPLPFRGKEGEEKA